MGQVAVYSGVERRRRWSDDERWQILEEAFAPGAKVLHVARRHDISIGLIYTVSIRRRPQGASAFSHELGPALIEELVELVEPASGECGGGHGVVVEAVDDPEAAVFVFHLLGKVFDHVDVDAQPGCGVASREHHRGRRHQAAFATWI